MMGHNYKAIKDRLYGFAEDVEAAKDYIRLLPINSLKECDFKLKLIEKECKYLLHAISKARELRDVKSTTTPSESL